ncbi:uncharacterized protein PG986_002223 [Apiospora aurea]|uniref:Uncharacterized protein n=1 Tax=Apiospora aurea TaxID=335848 RepID=A0ABR1QZ05_9PEZI
MHAGLQDGHRYVVIEKWSFPENLVFLDVLEASDVAWSEPQHGVDEGEEQLRQAALAKHA